MCIFSKKKKAEQKMHNKPQKSSTISKRENWKTAKNAWCTFFQSGHYEIQKKTDQEREKNQIVIRCLIYSAVLCRPWGVGGRRPKSVTQLWRKNDLPVLNAPPRFIVLSLQGDRGSPHLTYGNQQLGVVTNLGFTPTDIYLLRQK